MTERNLMYGFILFCIIEIVVVHGSVRRYYEKNVEELIETVAHFEEIIKSERKVMEDEKARYLSRQMAVCPNAYNSYVSGSKHNTNQAQ